MPSRASGDAEGSVASVARGSRASLDSDPSEHEATSASAPRQAAARQRRGNVARRGTGAGHANERRPDRIVHVAETAVVDAFLEAFRRGALADSSLSAAVARRARRAASAS